MSRRAYPLLALACVSLAACGARDAGERAPVATASPRAAALTTPAPAEAAAALSRIADSSRARRRVGYVNLRRLRDLRAVAPSVLDAVLGAGAKWVRRVGRDSHTAVAVGGAIVLRGGPRPDAGLSSGSDGIVIGAHGDFAGALTRSRPPTNVIAPETASVVQSCLGDASAETILGPTALGSRSAIGAGLRPSGVDGQELAICVAPHFRRDLRRVRRRLRARYPKAAVGQRDIGERDIVAATIAARSLPARRLLELLGGGRALRTIATG